MAKPRQFLVTLDASTARWLAALARSQKSRPTFASDLLAQAAFCLADCAGRRTGSWEADVGRTMLVASGFSDHVSDAEVGRCRLWDFLERRRSDR